MRVGQELRLVERHKNQTNQAFSSTTRTLCLLHVVVPTWLTPTEVEEVRGHFSDSALKGHTKSISSSLVLF